MPLLPLAKGTYKRYDNAEIRLSNRLYEQDPTNLSDQVSLIPRPGLTTWKAPGVGGTRGMFRFEYGGIFAIVGTSVRGYTSAGIQYSGFDDVIPGTGNCTFATVPALGGANILICNGQNVYRGGFGQISMPDSAVITSIDSLASRVVASRGNSGRFYWTAPNSYAFDALSYATAEAKADDLVCLKTLRDELWLFGTSSIEVWSPTADPDLPFQLINGRSFDIGCANRTTVTRLDTLYWVGGEDRRVFRAAPNPVVISDPSVDERLKNANIADLNALAFTVGSHSVYVLNMGAQGSLAYDITTGQWTEFSSLSAQDFRARYAAPFGDGRYMCGDTQGRFNFIDPDTFTDNGDPIERVTTGYLGLNTRSRCDNIILQCSIGNATNYVDNPVIALRMSDDKGRTWSDWETQSLGHKGEYDTQVFWRGLGGMDRPGRLFQFKDAEALPIVIQMASYNERP